MNKLTHLILLMLFSINSFSQPKKTVYSGTIKNYHTHPDLTTGNLVFHNVVTGEDAVHLIQIAPNGTFSIEFPMIRNQSAWLMFPFSRGHIYFEPGSKVIQDFDFSTYPKVNTDFRGDLAAVNNDIWKASIATAQPANYEKEINGFSPAQYKAYMLKRKNSSLRMLDSLRKGTGLSKFAYRRAKAELELESAIRLMDYSNNMEVAHRLTNSISFANRKPTMMPTKLDAAYYDFLAKFKYNDIYNMSLPSYRIFVNRLQEIDPIYTTVKEKAKAMVLSGIKEKHLVFTQQQIDEHIEVASKNWVLTENTRPEVLKRITRTNANLEIDLINIQQLCHNMKYSQEPLTDSALLLFKSKLKHPQFIEEVTDVNNKIKKNIADSKISQGSIANETPKGPADSLIDNLLKKYKGKTVFIDFWATWCAPCLEAIENLSTIKSELLANDIVFLYVTNTTSPEKSYQVIAPGIKGEHFRLTAEEYGLISAKLGIVGFPHYAIANKNGVIIEKDYRWANPLKVRDKLSLLSTEDK